MSQPKNLQPKTYYTFEEFWPFYLSQHRNLVCRRLHIYGTTLALMLLTYCLITGQFSLIVFCPVVGYFFSWIGHFVFEKNRPATFKYPIWSLMGDFKMLGLFYSGALDKEMRRLNLS